MYGEDGRADAQAIIDREGAGAGGFIAARLAAAEAAGDAALIARLRQIAWWHEYLTGAGYQLAPGMIPGGGWQRVVGGILFALGLFASLAATPFNGAGSVAEVCLAIAGPLLFWGVTLKYLNIIERKVDRSAAAHRPPAASPAGTDRVSDRIGTDAG